MEDKPLPAPTDKQGIIVRLTSFISRACQIPPKPRIELMSENGRLKASSRKRLVTYLGVSAIVIIIASFALVNFILPPFIPDFELQVNEWRYEPSIGSFRVSGTIGNEVPSGYSYLLTFLSITDGNKTIILDPSYEGHGGTVSIRFKVSQWHPDMGTDWTFLMTQRITLESKNVQLTFGYEISNDRGIVPSDVLEKGTEVFSVNLE